MFHGKKKRKKKQENMVIVKGRGNLEVEFWEILLLEVSVYYV